MPDHPLSPETEFALRMVKTSAALARNLQQRYGAQRSLKPDRSPVTLADFAVQALVAGRLKDSFPNDRLVAEEEAGQVNQLQALVEQLENFRPGVTPAQVLDWIRAGGAEARGRFWTLDPVDGTKGFLRGEQYAVALALIEDGQVMLGALGCPNLNREGRIDLNGSGSLAWAVRGGGAWIESLDGGRPRRLAVSPIADPSQARMLRSAAAEHTDLSQLDSLQRHLGIAAEPVLMDSQAKYVVLAAGQAELIYRLLSPDQLDYRERIWDQAAGSLLVEEAGGMVTDLDGKTLDFAAGRMLTRNRGVLATNRQLHPDALQALVQVRHEFDPDC
jgi:3'(2'), 5'-bisphosphate nucleotidase